MKDYSALEGGRDGDRVDEYAVAGASRRRSEARGVGRGVVATLGKSKKP